MLSLHDSIARYFPEEKVIRHQSVRLADKWFTKIGSIPVSWSKMFYITTVDMVETNTKIYFDRRQSYRWGSIISFFAGPIFLSFLLFLYLYYVNSGIQIALILACIVFVVASAILSMNIMINAGLTNILTLDKRWLTNITESGNSQSYEGDIPPGASYAFVHFISKELQKNLSITDRFISQLKWCNFITNRVHTHFTLQVTPV